MEQRKFDAETVIADFLGDVCDGHERIGSLIRNRTNYETLRSMAKVLIRDLKENGHEITGEAGVRHAAREIPPRTPHPFLTDAFWEENERRYSPPSS